MKLALLLATTLTLSVGAAVQRKPKDDLAHYRSEVQELGARLNTLEKELGSKNNLYLAGLDQIKQYEGDIELYKNHLNEKKAEVKAAQDDNKRILQSYLAESDSEGTEDWQRRVHFQLLKQAQDRLKNKEIELASFEAKIVEFEGKLSSLKSTEEELAQMISELETKKRLAMETYQGRLKVKNKVEKRTEKSELTKRLNVVKKQFSNTPVVLTKPDRFFAKPIDDFLSSTPSPKGVTFKYNAIQPVKAVGSGKVVFAGDLASYGQVVLIDHGSDLRTVLLGKMNIRVKKNDTVADGDVLGYTQSEGTEAQNLYFEVRKKNTAQNTILWLDPNGVSKI